MLYDKAELETIRMVSILKLFLAPDPDLPPLPPPHFSPVYHPSLLPSLDFSPPPTHIFPLSLKVLNHENFELAFFTLSDTIWIGDFGTEPKNRIFYIIILVLISMKFLLFAASSVFGKTFF